MRQALGVAKKALRSEEVPIGAMVVVDGKIVARAYNRREQHDDPTAHCEVIAIRRACKRLGDWRLDRAELFVTVEPCLMCFAVAVQARVQRIVFGCSNPKQPVYLRTVRRRWPNAPTITGGILADECAGLLSAFFRDLRKK